MVLYNIMDKLWLLGLNLGRVFSSRSGCMRAMHLLNSGTSLPNLGLKTRTKQFIGSLLLAFLLPNNTDSWSNVYRDRLALQPCLLLVRWHAGAPPPTHPRGGLPPEWCHFCFTSEVTDLFIYKNRTKINRAITCPARSSYQGILTEGDSTVQFPSSLRYVVV